MVQSSQENMQKILVKLSTCLAFDTAIPFLVIDLKGVKTHVLKVVSVSGLRSYTHHMQKCKQPNVLLEEDRQTVVYPHKEHQ